MTENLESAAFENDSPDAGGAALDLQDLVSLIALTHSRMIRPFERSFTDNYTGLQIMTLCLLMRNGPCSITDIASELCLSKQQTAKLIAKLNLRGCVRRFHPDDDHRVVLVELTEDTVSLMKRRQREFYSRLTERIAQQGDPGAIDRFNSAAEEIRRVLAMLPVEHKKPYAGAGHTREPVRERSKMNRADTRTAGTDFR